MSYLLPQHFSAIAAAGPIVGPILAAIYFGWGPAWLWIILGSVLIGGIHDFSALVASVRHRGRSVAEIVRQYMNQRAYILFLVFVWFALVYVIVAFTDVTAGTFVAEASREGGTASGPGVASSSTIYLLLAVAMGLALRFTGIGPVKAKLVFLPLVFLAIWAGPHIPMDLRSVAGDHAQQVWGYILLGYCFVAALAPVWILLQPRGELGGYFLYIVMILAVGGIVAGSLTGGIAIQQDFFRGWSYEHPMQGALPLFPILFITVACGACSGFHSIVASGTTSKQLDRETDARPVAYGAMLLEGFFACVSLATVMILAGGDLKRSPDWIYANGVADFGARLVALTGLDRAVVFDFLFQFGLLCFATFVFDTLDACTRLARYVLMELLGWTTRAQAALATVISLALPVVAVSLPRVELGGKPMPLWQVFWGIFGSSNQLLAALTLLGVTVWLARKGMAWWVALVPTLFMMVMTLWSLVLGAQAYIALWRSAQAMETIRHFQFGITLLLIALSGWLIVEALKTWHDFIRPSGDAMAPGAAAAGAGAD
jgi:carbon starvation protein